MKVLLTLVLGLVIASCGDDDSDNATSNNRSAKKIKVVDWGSYSRTYVGMVTRAPRFSSTPSKVNKAYALASNSAGCRVTPETGAVTGISAGVENCKVVLTLSASGYKKVSHTYTITVEIGGVSVADWGEYGDVHTGENVPAPVLVTTPTDASRAYATTSDSTGCNVDPASGAVTGVTAGTDNCKVLVTLSANGYNDTEHTYVISVKLRRIMVSGSNDTQKWGIYSAVTVGETATAAPAIGATTPAAVSKSYATQISSTGCSVDPASGVVTGTANGTNNCKVVLTLSATGYENLLHIYTISVQPGMQRGIVWNVGTTSVQTSDGELALAAVSNAHSTATVSYGVTSAGTTNCRFKGASGVNARTLLFDTAGTCSVQATAVRVGYTNWKSPIVNISVTNNAPIGITWNGYGNSNTATFGQSAPSLIAPTLNPTSATATYGSTGSACSVFTSNGALTLLAAGTCVVTLTATPANNNHAVGTASVTVTVNKGTQSAPAASNIYGSSPDLATGGTLDVIATPSGGYGTVEYNSTTLTICQVNGSTGTVTALRNGSCRIQARWSGNGNYNASNWANIQTIAISKGTITISDAGSFSGSLAVGGDALTPSAPNIAPTTVNISYALKANEADCTLVTPTTGEVRAANVVVTPGTTACTIVLTANLVGYNSATAEISVNLLKDALTFSSPPSDGGNALTVGGQLKLANIPTKDDNTVAVTWSFAAAGTRNGSTQSGVCSVNNTGMVTAGSSAQVGDICQITSTASATGYNSVALTLSLTVANPNPVEIASGREHSCVRFSNGGLKCWGKNDEGQLGYGNQDNRGDNSNEMGSRLPWINLGVGKSAKAISAGTGHTCAILNDDSVKCWGRNFDGELGIGDSDNNRELTPTAVNLGTGKSAKMIATGHIHTCAILNDDSLKCWGSNTYGQLGYGDKTHRNAPADSTVNLGTGKSAKKIATGAWHTCAILNDNSVRCWGSNYAGQLGIDSQTSVPSPRTVDLGEGRSAQGIFLGLDHTCALLDDDALACWGKNSYNQAGIAHLSGTLDPKFNLLVPHIVNFAQDDQYPQSLSLGEEHTCAILDDDSLICWGSGANGQLGYESTDNQSTLPTTSIDLGTDKTVTMVTSGRGFTCALLNDHTVKCWGRNSSGELGAEDSTVVWGDDSSEMGDNLQIVPLF